MESPKPEADAAPTAFAEMLALVAAPEAVQAMAAAERIAGFDIPSGRQAAFQRFHASISDPPPAYVTAMRSTPASEKWYHRHVNGVLGDVRGALAAAHYHKDNLARIERDLLAALAGCGLVERMGRSTMALGATRKLDFEYQAFVLACRRALDYLAGAVGAYFRTEASSFRSLPRTLRSASPAPVAHAVVAAHGRHAAALDFIMAEGRRSVRNRIAHYEFVSAGSINISRRGLMLVGGGEELRIGAAPSGAALDEVLAARLDQLHACVDDVLASFVSAAAVAR